MANEKRSGDVGNGSLSRERMERAQWSGKRSGWMLWVFLLAVVGGAVWYGTQVYLPEREAVAYEKETSRLLGEANATVLRLNEWSSDAELEAFSAKLSELGKRGDVDAARVAAMESQLEGFAGLRRERGERFEGLLARVGTFTEKSGRAEIAAFSETVREAKGKFDEKELDELEKAWARRRSEIGANVVAAPGEMTLRTIPSNAEAFLDGKRIAVTPFSAKGLLSGKRELLLKRAGYRDMNLEIVIEAGGHLELGPLELVPIAGGVRIEVTGGRARDKVEVEIEEFSETLGTSAFEVVQGYQVLVGRTHSLDTLKTGKYSVTILKNEKVAHRDTFVVEEGKVTEYRFEL